VGKLNGLDLFSGIGGLSLALSEWVQTIAYCECDRYPQAVLLDRMLTGDLDAAPIWDDVKTLTKLQLPSVDIISGGFPCQDISVAGAGIGLGGERSGLFYEIIRLTGEIRPTFVFLENVPAIRTRGLREVVRAFTNIGYDCRWTCVSAAEVGAPHLRKRWFLLAYRQSDGRNEGRTESAGVEGRLSATGSSSQVPDDDCERLSQLQGGQIETEPHGRPQSCRDDWWAAEPDVGRVAYGVPNRVDRLKCLGNAVVPSQAREAFMRLIGLAT
jgi:DNA (cytosine-5)-methyltransferase 1